MVSGKIRARTARPRLLPPAVHRAGIHRKALPPDRRAPLGPFRPLRLGGPAPPLLVPLRLPEHQLHPPHGPGPCPARPHPPAPGRLLRPLLRAPLPRSPPLALPPGRDYRPLRGGTVLVQDHPDRRRRPARRQLDRPRRVQMGPRPLP